MPRGNGGVGTIKSVSLKNLAQKVQQQGAPKPKQEDKQVEEPIDLSWNDAFDQEKLDEVWRRYTRQYENSPRLHTIYKNHPPQIVQGKSLLVKVRNQTQQHELNKERSRILSFLKRSLRNAGIELNFEISQEEDKNAPKAFTVADKYKVMSEKNPALALFKKQFNLDLE